MGATNLAVTACLFQLAMMVSSVLHAQEWGGPYVGGHLGASTLGIDYDHQPEGFWSGTIQEPYLIANGSGVFSSTTLSGGLHAGYNVQRPRFVYGLEADISVNSAGFAKDETLLTGVFVADYSTRASTDWVATVRGRLGVPMDQVLPYVTGGLAVSQQTFRQSVGFNGGSEAVGQVDSLGLGLVVGVGVDLQLDDQWSLRVEALHLATSGDDVVLQNEAFPAYPHRVKTDWSTTEVRLGLSFHF